MTGGNIELSNPVIPERNANRKALLPHENHMPQLMRIIEQNDGTYLVQSESTPDVIYTVNLDVPRCRCPAFTFRDGLCKHLLAALDFALGDPTE